ncbi:hypothetical protein D7Z54_35220 [Salibacterium salarium]|uniref:Uncharacterized protein n=1 Tax=Salibacterium salarium TaxID=284579 RepID=A0A428MRP5_9BACI|nr:hypothetical protein [Salibacterium salarium]RSL28703.1 hypothetical protein D7Z54_35220 [Salibacterium salarium]
MLDLSEVNTAPIDAIAIKLGTLLLTMLLAGIIVGMVLRACKVPSGIVGSLSSIAALVAGYYWFQLFA